MIKTGIVIDAWKFPIFEKHLVAAKYTFEQHPGISSDTLTLKVMANSLKHLETVVRAANTEAARKKGDTIQ